MDLREQRYGIEIELTGITRNKVAKCISKIYGDSGISLEGDYYDTHLIKDNKNRNWKVMYDSSIYAIGGGDEYKVEIVSPILVYDDIDKLQEIVREVRGAGGKVNDSCGIHIHIDGRNHTPKTIKNFVNIVTAKEDLLYKALGVKISREVNYCQKTNTLFLEKINKDKNLNNQKIKDMWYDGRDGSSYRYDNSRYRGLNLHSFFRIGTIELRVFNSTLHAGKVKSYIQLCLAISNQALSQRSVDRLH